MAQPMPPVPPAPPAQSPPPSPRTAATVGWAILIVALIIVASTASAFLVYMMFNRPLPASPAASVPQVAQSPARDSTERAQAEAAAVPPLGPTLDAGEFVVNLAPGPGLTIRYVRVGVVLEFDRREAPAELERRQPQLRDTILTVFRHKTVQDLSTTEGLNQVRDEMAERLNRLLSKGQVVHVYFTDLVIQ